MADIHPTQDQAPRVTCPQCGRFNERGTLVVEPSGIHTVTYLCPRNHQYLVKWLVGELVS